ncbi:MAG: TetR/AcrR family transcriptional regulator [Myxococcales bacterium]|nr:TetR/AcrR family transcriptional regulator [Myxococcales bacterium]MCB9732657.1 TetR/AcrR family transcriptional regulator [Deltaproteobacteria bacterium]
MVAAPTSSPRRQRRWEARRRELLDAAVALIARDGIDAFSLSRLAAELDIAVGGIYRYFRARDGLLAELLIEVAGDVRERLFAAGEPAGVAWVRAAVDAYVRFADEAPERFALLSRTLADPRPLVADPEAEKVLEATAPLIAAMSLALDAGARHGELAPGPGAARAARLWAALQGALQLRKLGRFTVTAEIGGDLARDVADDLLRAWAAAPAAR